MAANRPNLAGIKNHLFLVKAAPKHIDVPKPIITTQSPKETAATCVMRAHARRTTAVPESPSHSGIFGRFDGWNTFDPTLLDAYYATRLLRVGGYLAIDDASWASIHRVVSFLRNYPCYREYATLGVDWHNSWRKLIARKLMSPISQSKWAKILHPSLHRHLFEKQSVSVLAFKKVAEHERDWDWHVDSFWANVPTPTPNQLRLPYFRYSG
jgi:hypothetical protein